MVIARRVNRSPERSRRGSDVAILKRGYILAAISGILLAIPFIYPSAGVIVWFGLSPLFFAAKSSNLKNAPFLGLVFGVVFFATALYWIRIFGFLAWGSLSLLLSVWDVLFAVGLWMILKSYRGVAQFALVPSLWALCEFGRSLGPWGFSWGFLGSTVDNPFLLKIASYSGELGLGFIIVLVNLGLFRALTGSGIRERVRGVAGGVAIALAAVLIWPAVGLALPNTDEGSKAETIKVAVIQPNIAQAVKLDTSNNNEIKARYLVMTREALKSKPDLIIWPENILASYISDEDIYLARVKLLLAPTKTPLIMGGLNYVDGDTYNSAFYINAQGGRQEYRKIHLVPFGEYMPMRSLVERLNSMAKIVRNIKQGSDYKVFSTAKNAQGPVGKFSVIICFESSDPALVSRMVRNGARMIVVITNDAWFRKTAALVQHFRVTRMRAVENGIPFIQAANTGVSGVIDSSGKVISRTGIEKQQLLHGTVTFASRPSFFARFGYLMTYLYLAFLMVGLLYRLSSPAQSRQ